MQRLRNFGIAIVALTISWLAVGCKTSPRESPSKQADRMQEISAATQVEVVAPERTKNQIVELAWRIAESDNLSDPDSLFRQTLAINSFNLTKESWGVLASAGGESREEEVQNLPNGIRGFFYFHRIDLNGPDGRRYLIFSIDSKKSCVTLEDVAASFGKNFWPQPHLPPPASPSLPAPDHKPGATYGISYKSPHFFMKDSIEIVNFTFEYQECVSSISIQRALR